MIPEIKIPERKRAVLVVASGGDGVAQIANRLAKEISARDNFHFIGTEAAAKNGENRARRRFFRKPRSRQEWQQSVEGVDCVWLHDALSLDALAAFRAAQRLGKPVLVTQHKGPVSAMGFMRRGWAAWLDRSFTRTVLRDAYQATFTSDATADFYYQRVPFAAPVKIIPNGIDPAVFQPPLPEKRVYLRARFALRDEQPVLLFKGRFDATSGMAAIRHLARALPQWRFWLAGEGRINPEKWFLPNVQVFRNREGAALAELYQAADLLILPGHYAGFPQAAQEAMACGLPVMCSPATAEGSHFARPYLWLADTDPSPRYTAELWIEKLKRGQHILPLTGPKMELFDLAQSVWEWPKIADYYAETLRGLCKYPQKH